MNSHASRRRNVFVIGLDDEHRRDLEQIPDRDRFHFHPLLEREDVRVECDVDHMIEEAEAALRSFDGPVDAIIGYWDFPVTAVASILCETFELPSPSLEALHAADTEARRLVQELAQPASN